ncbi:cation transporter [Alteromonas pelagimontana]|uniref:Cation transporter n=1 Tax=Alteromonas pelagimontana TaxID=1858656 RepID=A0A6M4MAZ9_9ALTE|nr:cation transporter [Alteromonas pelagimontana]QJR80169.1 cation transporter [Alteromonas pelagimontana]
MKLVPQYEFTEEQTRALHKARVLEYISIAYLISVIILMYIVMGSSQAMKTAWIEDCLSLIPPICFLIGTHVCWRKPTVHYPYGFHRIISILFLCAALALLLMGSFLLIDALIKLSTQEHPTIGMKEFFAKDIWLGWWMILVLLWGIFPPVILGLAKTKQARMLNDKVLYTDGKMNKADWLTAVAAIGGVLGIGMGWWWADAVAAAFISFDILKDGWSQTKDAVTGLINRVPTSLDNNYLDLVDKAEKMLTEFSWIKQVQVRLFEHGHLIYGEGFVNTYDNASICPEDLRDAMKKVRELDWRLQDFALTVEPHVDSKK